MSVVTDTRDAVASSLAAAMKEEPPLFAPLLSVDAGYDFYDSIDGLKAAGGRVMVTAPKKTCDPASRGGPRKRQIDVYVAVQYKYTTGDTKEIDPYQELAEAIADYFERKTLSNGATIVKVDHPQLWSDEHFRSLRVFTSVLTLTCLIFQ